MLLNKRFFDKSFKITSTIIALLSSLILVGVLVYIFRESLPIWQIVGPISFITGTVWSPVSDPPSFGIASMVVGTLWVAFGALLIAVPLGFSCAIFLAEFAPNWIANILRPVLNILTGIPSVVYGFLGAAILVRFFENAFDLASGESLFCASLVLAIMVIPYIVGISEAAIRSVPDEYRLAGRALGVSKPYTTIKILLPMAKKGMLGSVVLAFGRAAGETMAVLMLAGNVLKFPSSWFSMGEPLPALIALELGSSAPGTMHYQALFAAGLVLITFVTLVNILINRMIKNNMSQVNNS
ncbi:Phosphate ABC transporter, permease protein PstC [Candidatus Syntrophocurvum alkaliphilum]|uniref:Phosphate transport system permease protein n=1 Tax=Candidatus Syntrophocurvum alkaliphilum TaxID=2293317 RepID=A0A6I6DHZ6_9FIRM|nr:phosphate ABC transporter permease subunit PstC [Candidatus Syntrophocurvum alkaliphilum]QGU00389.1 Phosphate ABC transporter, permease protein PstC [Candidatus Syntrophocurvum alkaliphilum]